MIQIGFCMHIYNAGTFPADLDVNYHITVAVVLMWCKINTKSAPGSQYNIAINLTAWEFT